MLDADLRFFGDDDQQWLTGTVDVRQAVWTRRYDVASELLASDGAPLEGAPPSAGGVRYDVKVARPAPSGSTTTWPPCRRAPTSRLQGSYRRPVVLGRAEIDRGRVYFQGNTYVIRRGTIDFTNPQKIDPLFDIEAETRVRSYRVTLKVNGTLERVYPTLTSDPPLRTVGILGLLAGRRRERRWEPDATAQAAPGAAGRQPARPPWPRAASRSRWAGARGGRLLGLNRFSIDPNFAARRRARNPHARA